MDEYGSLQRFDNFGYETLQTLKSYQENILEKHKNDFIEKVFITKQDLFETGFPTVVSNWFCLALNCQIVKMVNK